MLGSNSYKIKVWQFLFVAVMCTFISGLYYTYVFYTYRLIDLIDLLCFNGTFSTISAISWRTVLVVEEAGVPGENHQPWASNWKTLSLSVASRVHPFL